MIRQALVIGGLLLVLGATNLQIVQKERLLRDGASILLELAPVDPRSLIQGDYMALDYAIAREITGARAASREGHLVVAPDADGVARFVRFHDTAVPLAPGEHLLLYRVREGRARIGTNAFYFQEGHADRYTRAKYGELKVDAAGGSLLVGLRDVDRKPMGADPIGEP